MTTAGDIKNWLLQGREQEATHVIIVCDTFGHEDYPVYVSNAEDVRLRLNEITDQKMQRVMEVYNLSLSLDEQLDQERAMNF